MSAPLGVASALLKCLRVALAITLACALRCRRASFLSCLTEGEAAGELLAEDEL